MGNVNQEKEAIPTATAMNSKPSFPLTVNLDIKPLQMAQITEGKPEKDWELIKEIPFGEVKQQKIVLNIYQEPKKPDTTSTYIHAMVRFHGTNLGIRDELMEVPTVEHSTMFLLQHTFSDHDNQLVLLGGIQLFANGPGRVAYVMYDSLKNKWYTFEDWGKPRFVDLDSDGVDEFVIQHEGLHTHPPDITIYIWNKGIIEASESIKSAVLGGTDTSYAKLGDDKKITIGEVISQEEARYIYDNGKLLKQ
jgi:hypothetical protein